MKTPDYVTLVDINCDVTDETLDAQSAAHFIDIEMSLSKITNMDKLVNVKRLHSNNKLVSLGNTKLEELSFWGNRLISDVDLCQTSLTKLYTNKYILDR